MFNYEKDETPADWDDFANKYSEWLKAFPDIDFDHFDGHDLLAAAKRSKGPQDASAQAKGKLTDTLGLLKAMDAQMRSDGVTGTWPCFSKMAEGTCRFRQCKRCEAGATWDKVADKDKVRAIIKAALSKSAPNSEAVRFAEALAKKAA